MNGLEQLDDFVEAELESALTRGSFDGLLGEEALLFLELENTFFDGVGDGELVDDDVDGLGEAVDSVYGLFFNKLQHSLVSDEMGRRRKEGLIQGKKNLRDSKTAQ